MKIKIKSIKNWVKSEVKSEKVGQSEMLRIIHKTCTHEDVGDWQKIYSKKKIYQIFGNSSNFDKLLIFF